MSWSPWPARLEIFGDAYYRDELLGRLGIHWYVATLGQGIIPWITVEIHDFYAEVVIGNTLTKANFLMESEDQYGNPIKVKIGKGYILDPKKPIGESIFGFSFMAKSGEVINPKAYSVLEVGIRKIRKSFLLKQMA